METQSMVLQLFFSKRERILCTYPFQHYSIRSIFFESFLNYASVAYLVEKRTLHRFAGQAREFKSKIYILNLSTSLCDGSASKSRQVYLQLTYYPPLQPPVNAIRQIYLQRISLYNNGNSCLQLMGFELFQLVKIENLTF